MTILQQVVPVSCTVLPPLFPVVSPFPLLSPSRGFVAQKQRRALPAPKIVGYLPAPRPLDKTVQAGGYMETPLHDRVLGAVSVTPELHPAQSAKTTKPERRVVVAEIANPLVLMDIRSDFDAWWAEFERVHGRVRTTEEMDAELEASHPGYMARFGRKSNSSSDAVQVEVA